MFIPLKRVLILPYTVSQSRAGPWLTNAAGKDPRQTGSWPRLIRSVASFCRQIRFSGIWFGLWKAFAGCPILLLLLWPIGFILCNDGATCRDPDLVLQFSINHHCKGTSCNISVLLKLAAFHSLGPKQKYSPRHPSVPQVCSHLLIIKKITF